MSSVVNFCARSQAFSQAIMVIIYYLILWKCGIPCTQYRQVELVTSCGKNMFIVLFILPQSE